MIRLIGVLIWIGPATIWYGGRMIWAVLTGSSDKTCICQKSPKRWASQLLWISGVKICFENIELINPNKPQILVANHSSWYDVLALVLIPGTFVFVAKRELASIPIFGRAIGSCGHIFVDRQDRSAAVRSLDVAKDLLENDSPTIIMFPEGTRTKTGELQKFKKGAFVLAIQTGVDVLPAAVVGSREVMKKGSLRIKPGTITVRVGMPIEVDGLNMEDRNELTEGARNTVMQLQAQGAQTEIEPIGGG
ncbi:MAG TPA: hypothetical protein DHW11_01620 [Gemmatimonadetes bacterium]|jgi:1-acyl-sn-glycerol-3-phosphate acyltransferase|nr:hypothetical protein [Gemmatimonadota bacterium]|tara:strand:- start:1591 stop:2334 length:744 start_codon:yes stop_codon:yes gene_type:complete